MEKEGVDHEFISFENVPEEIIKGHFPHIYEKCLEEGYDILKEPGTDRSGTALFYGRRPCGPRFGNDYAASVCGRGDKLQRGSREEPACQQQSHGEPCFCKALPHKRSNLHRKEKKNMNPITMQLVADKYIKMALEEDINSEDVSTNAVMPEYKKGDVQLICNGGRNYCGFTDFRACVHTAG